MGKVFTDGDVLTANDANTYLQAIASVVPDVAGSGVSIDTATGIISFSSATSIVVDNCFTTDYRNYRINIESTGTAANLTFNLRASGTNSATNYDRTELLARNGTVTSGTTLDQTGAIINGMVNTLHQCDIEVSGAALALPTTILSRAGVHANPAASSTSNGLTTNYITHRPSTAYDGFELTYSNAQSGTIRIYGYN